VVVPCVAVQRGPDGSFVFVVKPDKTVDTRPVTVALAEGNVTAISNGLQSGDFVVTDGQDKLQKGMRVEPQTRPANTPNQNTSAPQPAS